MNKKYVVLSLMLSSVYFFYLYEHTSVENGLAFVGSVMIFCFFILQSYYYRFIFAGMKTKAKITKKIKGFAHLDRVDRNSYFVSFKNRNNKLVEKRTINRTSKSLKEGSVVDIFVSLDDEVVLAGDLKFTFPFSFALIIAPIAFIYI